MDVAVVVVGMNRDIFVSLSTITKIALCLIPVLEAVDSGSSPIKSAEMDSHGRSGMGSCFSRP